jgi:hypothetical protein
MRGVVSSIVAFAVMGGLMACVEDTTSDLRHRNSGSSVSDVASVADAAASTTPQGPVTPTDDASTPSSPDASAPVACAPIAGSSFDHLSVPTPTDRPAAVHADLNLTMHLTRVAPGAAAALQDIAGPTDSKAPKLYSLFTPDRTGPLSGVYQVQQWDWGCNCGKGYITDPAVTLAGLTSTPGEVLVMPRSGYDIGGGHGAMVLYAHGDTITLKLTRDDNVVYGYTIHVEGVCLEPSLVAAYEKDDLAGRHQLPALKPGQGFGRAIGAEVKVAIRDTGSLMDPRSRKDWW